MKIEPYIHRCVVQQGPAAGNKVAIEVEGFDVEYGKICEHCGEPLATIEQLVAHIYEELRK